MTREATALEHLSRYPVATLDRRSLEILRPELERDTAFHRAALEELEASDPGAPELPEWRDDVAARVAALTEVDYAIAGGMRLK